MPNTVSTTLEEGEYILANSGESYQVIFKPIEVLREEGFFSILDNNNETHFLYFKADVLAENYLYFETINPFPGEKDTIDFKLINPNSVIGFQLDIINDENIEFLVDDIFLSTRKDDHTISASIVNESITRIISYSLSSSAYKENDGIIFSLPILIKSNAISSVKTINNDKMVLSSISGDNIAQELNVLGSIKIGNFTPTGNIDNYTIDEDVILEVSQSDGVLKNDSDIENDAISVVLAEDVSNGTLNLNSNGSFTYTPNLHYFGTDTFKYFVEDNYSKSQEIEVILTINPVNDLPTSKDIDTITTQGIPIVISLSGEDIDNENLSFSIVQDPLYGNAVLSNNEISYTSNSGYFGLDSILFIVSDSLESSSPYTIRIEVNDVPISSNISLETKEDESIIVEFDVTNNYGSIDIYTIISGPLYGTLSDLSDNTVSYSPQENYYGIDSLFYSVTDSYGAESNIAKVLIEIDSVYDIPSVNITIIDSEINESGGSTKLIANLDGVDAGDAEVSVAFSLSGTASSSDYSTSESSITIPKSSTETEVIFTSVDDSENEQDEIINITIGDVVNALLSSSGTLQITIIDDDLPLGIENEYLIKNIYPNPTSERVTIELRKNRKILGVRVHDFSGKIVKSVKGNNSSSFTLPLHGMGDGIYILRVETDFENIVKKIIIDKKWENR